MNNILIIGFGKVGSALYNALHKNMDLQISVYDPFVKASEIQPKLNTSLVAASTLIIIAVQDDAIADVVQNLTTYHPNGITVLHTSGMCNLSVLDPLIPFGSETGVLHPLQSFSKRFTDPIVWHGTWCSFEGSEAAKKNARQLTDYLGAKFIQVTARQKQALHIAAVFSANFPVALLAAAEKILRDTDLDKALLEPLIQQVQHNFKTHPATKILSGPLQRGDADTIKAHLEFLEKPAYADLKKLYQDLAVFLLNNPDFDLQNRDKLTRIIDEL